MTLWPAALVFLAGATVLAGAGTLLARAGDEFAERTGLARLLVGMLVLAVATSLAELVTDVSAAVAGSPDMAVGDLFGSSMANMAVLAVIDLLHRGRVWASVELGQVRVASVAIGITALAALALARHAESRSAGSESTRCSSPAHTWPRSPGSGARRSVAPTGWWRYCRHRSD